MKVMLLLPMWDRKDQWGVFHRGAGNNNFSYGLVSIGAYLEQKGVDVEICDPQFIGEGEAGLRKRLSDGNYDVVGITCYTPTVTEVYRTAAIVREAIPNVAIVFGGPHPTSFPKECLRECPACDYVVVGEGEETLSELVYALRDGSDKRLIKGIAYRMAGDVVVTERRPFLDVNDLPLPAYHLQPPTRYHLQPTAYHRLPTVTLLASRGCPYNCSFCHAFEVLGRKPRYKAVDKLMNELAYLRDEFDARGFMFQDGTFTLNRGWTEDFCKAMKKAAWDVSWLCFTRADKVDRDLLRRMKDAGCWGISYGVESANQKSLDFIQKDMTVEQNEIAIRDSLELGMYVTATYMLGLPGESEEDVNRTISFAKKMGTHIAHFFLPLPYPKTVFYDQCRSDGGLQEGSDWSIYSMTSNHCPVYINPLLGEKRMHALKKRAIKEYYTNPKVVWRNILTIRGIDDLKKFKDAALSLTGLWL